MKDLEEALAVAQQLYITGHEEECAIICDSVCVQIDKKQEVLRTSGLFGGGMIGLLFGTFVTHGFLIPLVVAGAYVGNRAYPKNLKLERLKAQALAIKEGIKW